MEKRCVIISGGEYDLFPKLNKEDFIIACDKGYVYALRNGIRPDLIIADFDSFEGEADPEIPVLRYPCEKDDTDTMAAVKYAVEKGFSEVILCCALGGRLDHEFANLQSCAYAVERGLKASVFGERERITFLKNGSVEAAREEGRSLSVFSITDRSEGVSVTGCKYELKDALLVNSFPLGVSNEWKADKAVISVKSGILMIVESVIWNEIN